MQQSTIVSRRPKIEIFWALWRKDMRVAVRTPYTLITLVIPVLLSILFTFLFPGVADAEQLRIAVYDPGHSQLAVALATQPDLEIITMNTPEALEESVAEGFTAAIMIPADFDAAVQHDQQPQLIIYLNSRPSGTATFQRLLSEQVWQMRYDNIPAVIEWREVAITQSPSENLRASDYLLILLLTITLVMAGTTITSTAIVEEKGDHTLYPLLNSPVSAGDVILSKVLTGWFYTTLAVTTVFLLNQGWRGDWPLRVVALLLGAIFAVGVGLVLGLASGNRSQCNTWTSVISLTLCVPIWFAITSLDQLPILLRLAIQLIPTHYLILALTDTFQAQLSLASTGLNLALLGGAVILVYGVAARQLIHHQLYYQLRSEK